MGDEKIQINHILPTKFYIYSILLYFLYNLQIINE